MQSIPDCATQLPGEGVGGGCKPKLLYSIQIVKNFIGKQRKVYCCFSMKKNRKFDKSS